jgi:hypothetical protein
LKRTRTSPEPSSTRRSEEALAALLAAFLPDYVRLIDEDAAALLDFATLRFPPRESGGVDVVAEVQSVGGEKVTVCALVVPEPVRQEEIARWLRGLSRSLGLCLGEPLLASVVLLQAGRPGVNLETAVLAKIRDLQILHLYYTAFGLSASNAEYYLERPEPLAWALCAAMQPRYTRREAHIAACLRRVRGAGLEEAEREMLEGWIEGCDLTHG